MQNRDAVINIYWNRVAYKTLVSKQELQHAHLFIVINIISVFGFIDSTGVVKIIVIPIQVLIVVITLSIRKFQK